MFSNFGIIEWVLLLGIAAMVVLGPDRIGEWHQRLLDNEQSKERLINIVLLFGMAIALTMIGWDRAGRPELNKE